MSGRKFITRRDSLPIASNSSTPSASGRPGPSVAAPRQMRGQANAASTTIGPKKTTWLRKNMPGRKMPEDDHVRIHVKLDPSHRGRESADDHLDRDDEHRDRQPGIPVQRKARQHPQDPR